MGPVRDIPDRAHCMCYPRAVRMTAARIVAKPA